MNCPIGCEYHPNAPWNGKEPTTLKCEACGGHGKNWYAYHVQKAMLVECSENMYNELPDQEEEAINNLIQGDILTCDVYDGTGEVIYEPDYE